ncbi:MAG: hypothetical protein OXB96_01020 [Candidatus Kaiserbacteria bacterium]|nr:hypothetical protein [Candidatus Kaiserbacteria bacterium]
MGIDTSVIILSVLPGAIGGLVRGLVGIFKHVVRDKEPFQLSKLLFSLLLAVLVGCVVGVLTDGDWRVSLLAGFAGSDLLESLAKSRQFGVSS